MSQPANGVPEMKKSLGEIGRRRSYFCDKQRKSLNGLVATLNLEPGQSIPSDHPLKAFLDSNDQEMSVKEALAKTFTDYKVRLNKRHAPADSPVNNKRARYADDIHGADLPATGQEHWVARNIPPDLEMLANLQRRLDQTGMLPGVQEVAGSSYPAFGDVINNSSITPPVDIEKSISWGFLTKKEEVMLVIQSDTEVSPEILASNFDIPKVMVEQVLYYKRRVLQNTARVLIESFINNAKWPRRSQSMSKRRGVFFGLNILVWQLFQECADRGVRLTPKLIRDYAFLLSRQLGLTSFKGSDGWYDSFKKRHRISLTSMTGVSSLAEEDMDDIMVEMGELLKVLGDEDEDDEVEEEEVVVEEAQEPAAGNNQEQVVQAVLGQANPGPLEVNAAVNDEEEEEYDLPAIYEEPTTLPSLLLRSCSIYIPDPEISYYISILRNCILSRNPSLLSDLVQLQQLIVQILDSIAPHARRNYPYPPPHNPFWPPNPFQQQFLPQQQQQDLPGQENPPQQPNDA